MHKPVQIHDLLHRRVEAHEEHALHDNDCQLVFVYRLFEPALFSHQDFMPIFVRMRLVGWRVVMVCGDNCRKFKIPDDTYVFMGCD